MFISKFLLSLPKIKIMKRLFITIPILILLLGCSKPEYYKVEYSCTHKGGGYLTIGYIGSEPNIPIDTFSIRNQTYDTSFMVYYDDAKSVSDVTGYKYSYTVWLRHESPKLSESSIQAEIRLNGKIVDSYMANFTSEQCVGRTEQLTVKF